MPLITIPGLKDITESLQKTAFRLKQNKKKKAKTPAYSDDVLDLTTNELINKNFQPEPISDISISRPEIIAITGFSPIFSGDPKRKDFTSTGKFIEVSHQASLIRQETLTTVFKNILEAAEDRGQALAEFEHIRKNFAKSLDEASSTVGFYENALFNIGEINSFFNIKNIPAGRSDKTNHLSLKDVFIRYMGYTEAQYNLFTDSKILLQLLTDFKNISENYSFQLLDLIDSDRKSDKSASGIDTTYTLRDGFTFKVDKIRSTQAPKNALQRDFFNSFQNSLPGNAKNRLKLLFNLIGKEYKISNALGTKDTIGFLQDNFDIQDAFGTPFDNLIGVIGNSIFIPVKGENSFARLIHQPIVGGIPNIPDAQNRSFNLTVLPFESKHIDDTVNDKNGRRIFIPGKSYYINTIFDLSTVGTQQQGNRQDFNTGPLVQYVNSFSDSFTKLDSAYEFFSLSKGKNAKMHSLDSDLLYFRTMSSLFKTTVSSVLDNNKSVSIKNINKTKIKKMEAEQVLAAALLKLANKDLELKSLLFQYCLLVGITLNSDGDNNVWSDLVKELKSLEEFPAIKTFVRQVGGDLSEVFSPIFGKNPARIVKPVISQVIDAIDLRVKILLLPDKNAKKIIDDAKNGPLSSLRQVVQGELVQHFIPDSLIKTVLTKIVNGTLTDTKTNLIEEYILFVNKISNLASSSGERNYLLNDDSGRTRFNLLSTSTQLLIMFEIFTSLTKAFTFSEFHTEKGNITIKTNIKNTELVDSAIDEMIGSISWVDELDNGKDDNNKKSKKEEREVIVGHINRTPEKTIASIGDNAAQKSIVEDLVSIAKKLSEERHIVENILFSLSKIKEGLMQAKSKALNAYNPNTLQAFLEDQHTINDLRILKNESQIRNSQVALRDVRWKVANTLNRSALDISSKEIKKENIFITNAVHAKVKKALYTLLMEPKYQTANEAETRVKVLSVGLPTGFSRNLLDRVSLSEAEKNQTNAFNQKETDVITINVYRKNLAYEGINFKPRKYIFDLSLYQLESEMVKNLDAEEDWNDILKQDVLVDYANSNNPIKYTKSQLVSQEKYAFLASSEKQHLFSNHVVSFLLENYIRLSTGMKINEETFIVNEETRITRATDPRLDRLLISYIRKILKENIPGNQALEEILASPNTKQSIKDLIFDFKSGNVIFAPNYLKDKILSPKIFDRVFHIPLDVDGFEINQSTTDAYTYRDVLETRKIDGAVFFKPRTDRNILFEQFFITIENRK
jgi:hypothetical protein